MRILISNDDGVQADGIRVLAEVLSEVAEVVVVAPDRQRSAAGHGITLHKPLYVEEMTIGNGIRAYGVSGTPADCVKFGVNQILRDEHPDLVVSGINAGSNLGSDVMYSGTVSAAIEGAIQGIPSIAVSQLGVKDFDYTAAAKFTAQLAREVLKNGLMPETVLNVNVPQVAASEIRGVQVTTLGTRRYHNEFEERINPRGVSYYWLAGGLKDIEAEPESDIKAVRDGYISVSPVHFDFTNRQLMETLKAWQLD